MDGVLTLAGVRESLRRIALLLADCDDQLADLTRQERTLAIERSQMINRKAVYEKARAALEAQWLVLEAEAGG